MDTIRCSDCQMEFDLRENENGSILFPGAKCPHCGMLYLFGESGKYWDNIINSGRIGKIDQGITFKTLREGTPSEQVEELRVREYWVQMYVKENYRKLGFSTLEGPFDRGPDFQVTYEGCETYAEVEVCCDNYVKHGHPDDSRFNPDVAILIVLERIDPSDEIKDQLPKRIIHLDTEDFEKWYCRATREYAIQKEKEQPTKRAAAKLRLLAWEFQRRYCALCPLMQSEFEEDQDTELWEFEALNFLGERGTLELTLGDITPDELDQYTSKIIAKGGPRRLPSKLLRP